VLFDPLVLARERLASGDVVRFRPVDEEEYWAYLQVEEMRAFERRGR
jgi:allophanate hydrolase subunit 1